MGASHQSSNFLKESRKITSFYLGKSPKNPKFSAKISYFFNEIHFLSHKCKGSGGVADLKMISVMKMCVTVNEKWKKWKQIPIVITSPPDEAKKGKSGSWHQSELELGGNLSPQFANFWRENISAQFLGVYD